MSICFQFLKLYSIISFTSNILKSKLILALPYFILPYLILLFYFISFLKKIAFKLKKKSDYTMLVWLLQFQSLSERNVASFLLVES